MAKLGVQDIRKAAKGIIAASPGGIRYTALVRQIAAQHPETPVNTIHGSVWNLEIVCPQEISKPSRGLYKLVAKDGNGSATEAVEAKPLTATGREIRESDFYPSFAEWLKNDLDEVTEVAPLGGAGLKSKWGTPDVVGVYKPLAKDLIKFDYEIVSGEVKIDQQPVVAFGQAVAYRLFSTKTYIAMPTSLGQEDQDRLESLCMLFGVGLALFDLNIELPNFQIRVRAQRFSPDMFYVNEFAERLKNHDPDVFEDLFR
jgi:hypothetical protein